MAFPKRWQQILRKHMSAVPSGSGFSRYQQAVRDASAEYHGRTRSNPDGKGLVKLGLVLGGGYLAYKAIKGAQAKPQEPAYQPPQTGV